MKVENHDNLGNPYHDDRTGEFSSKNGGSNPLYRKKNAPLENIIVKSLPYRNNKGQKMNIKPGQAEKNIRSGNISPEEIKTLKEHDMLKDFKEKYGSGTQSAPAKVDPKLLNQNQSVLQNNMQKRDFNEVFNNISNSTFMKTLRFIISGFDFNKFKGVNRKVFKPKNNIQKPVISPKKQLEQDKSALRKEGMNLLNDYKEKFNDINVKIEQIQQAKENYQKKFGNSRKMFEKWWEKSNLKKLLIKAEQEQRKTQLEFNRQKEKYKNKLEEVKKRDPKMKGME